MITLRKNRDRGKGTTDWLNSFHKFMGFGALRVINAEFLLFDLKGA